MMSDDRKTMPSRTTRDEEARDAQVRAGADETEGPEASVDTTVDPAVSEHEKEMMERGAQQRGEGRLP
jgi:hypothetical protein